jgi:hypothetical protein
MVLQIEHLCASVPSSVKSGGKEKRKMLPCTTKSQSLLVGNNVSISNDSILMKKIIFKYYLQDK